MANVELMIENLEKAENGADMLRDDLRDALKNADAVQSLVIMKMIEKSADLHADILQLMFAVKSED